MDPFTNNFIPIKTGYKIEVPLTIQSPEEFTREPVTLGDHLRRRRIELELYQKDVAAKLGVEMGRDPEQLADWLSGRHKLCRRNREEIVVFRADHTQAFRTNEIF